MPRYKTTTNKGSACDGVRGCYKRIYVLFLIKEARQGSRITLKNAGWPYEMGDPHCTRATRLRFRLACSGLWRKRKLQHHDFAGKRLFDWRLCDRLVRIVGDAKQRR